MRFGLMFFGGDAEKAAPKYELVQHCARYADREGLSAVWIPERHFTRLGGLFPDPAVVLASLASITSRVGLRTGSVVLPIHEPVHVVESFGVLDQLSGGRVGLAFASGWNPDDFAFTRDVYAQRGERLFDAVDQVRQLWKTGTTRLQNGIGTEVDVPLYPRPVQPLPPIWIAAGRAPPTFQRAGACGASLLTHMLDVDADQLAERIALYRNARAAVGLDPHQGNVTVMLHTYLADTEEEACAGAKASYCRFIQANRDLFGKLADSRGRRDETARGAHVSTDIEELAEVLFERFYTSRSLIGAVDRCHRFVSKLESLGVDEIACLVDFGPADELVKRQLPHIGALQRRFHGRGNEPQPQPEPVPTSSLPRTVTRSKARYFRIEWLPVAAGFADRTGPACQDIVVAFVADARLGSEVTQRIGDRDPSAYVVRFGTDFTQRQQEFVIDGSREEHLQWVLGLVAQHHPGRALRVLNLVALSVGDELATSAPQTREAIRLCYDFPVRLAKACVHVGAERGVTLLNFTAGAAEIPEYDHDINPWHALTLSVSRILEYECPALAARHIDLSATLTAVHLAATIAGYATSPAVLGASCPPQWADRDGDVFVPVMVEASRPANAKQPRQTIRKEATYLISGGLGGLGLLLAEWLVEQGARSLLLCHRRSLPPRESWPEDVRLQTEHAPILRRLLELESLGARIHAARVDVTDGRKLSGILTNLSQGGMPPVAGVIHTAGVDPTAGRLVDIQPSDGAAVLDPKVLGGLTLHELFKDAPLDFFVLFSSWAGSLGALGQRLLPYSAANAFLDSLAQYRAAHGLPALSIAWGDWTEVGMRARAEARGEAHLLPLEWGISNAWGLQAFSDLLEADQPTVLAAPVNWSDFAALFSTVGRNGLLRRVCERQDAVESVPPARAPSTLVGSPDVESWFRATLGEHLKRTGVPLDSNRNLAALGLDSLGIMELRRQIKAAYGQELPLRYLMNPQTRAQDILERLTSSGSILTHTSPPPTPPEPAAGQTACLSFAQERMWVLQQLDPGGSTYNLAALFRIEGPLNVDALQQALRSLVARHEALRTSFEEIDGQPAQVVHAHADFDLTQIDCRQHSPDKVADLMRSQAATPFDLLEPPLIRAHLYRRTGHWDLLLQLHHIICDGWTIGILLSELQALYSHHALGTALSLPEIRAQYREYAREQRASGASADLQVHLAYWKEEMQAAGEPAIPTDYTRGKRRDTAVHRLPLAATVEECKALSLLAHTHGSSAYTVLFAAFVTMLFEYTECDDIIVGMPVACRDDSKYQHTAGLFANTVPIRARHLSGIDPATLVCRLHEKIVNGLEHAAAPFDKIVDACAVARQPGRNPLYQTLFAPQVVRNGDLHLPGLRVTALDHGSVGGVLDITASVTVEDEQLTGHVDFDGRLFTASTARCMTEHFLATLRRITGQSPARMRQSVSA